MRSSMASASSAASPTTHAQTVMSFCKKPRKFPSAHTSRPSRSHTPTKHSPRSNTTRFVAQVCSCVNKPRKGIERCERAAKLQAIQTSTVNAHCRALHEAGIIGREISDHCGHIFRLAYVGPVNLFRARLDVRV